MKRFGLVIAALAVAAFVSGQAMAQSAKFAANWSENEITLAEIKVDSGTPETPVAVELLATIKVPQGKELLIGVSGVANLITFTKAKGKNGAGKVTAVAEATMSLEVKFAPVGTTDVCSTSAGTTAVPGAITFASRIQTLTVDTNLTADMGVTISGFVEVGLELDTTAAHHMNFLAVDLDSGEYDVYACFSGEALKTVETDSVASALVAIKQRIVTVQEVRAVKDSIAGSETLTP